ncbi:MAG TPA: alpha-L-fucosidase, partial [Acidisoma sp.]|nr:alpha-L-fucosidase [Acidisoma sp.]
MNRRFALFLAAIFVLGTLGSCAQAQQPQAGPSPAPVPAKMQWCQDARFGMFIHWDPSSVAGAEISWSRDPNPGGPNPGGIPAAVYDKLYMKFDPVKFNPAEVVGLAKQAGMKYIVFTTKHHGGFCNFDSAYTDYKITSPLSPYRKDIVKMLANATHKAGLHWGIYYSQVDLHQPDYGVDQPAYDLYLRHQIEELITHYGKVDVIWFDGLGHPASYWDADSLFADIHRLDPTAIINDRCGLPGDFSTPEQRIGSYDDQRPWETRMTIST